MNPEETIEALSRLVLGYATLTHCKELDDKLAESYPDIWQKVMQERRERVLRQWNMLNKLGRISELSRFGFYTSGWEESGG